MAKPEKRKRARELRRKGWIIKAISEEIEIQRQTVSKWCRDIELTDEQVRANAEKDPKWFVQHQAAQKIKKDALQQRIEFQEAGRQRAREGSILHMKACILYWGEGAKGRNNLRFTNTDTHMLKLFMRFLREEFDIDDKEVYLNIMHHTTDRDEIERIKDHWLEWLNLTTRCTVKMQFKKGSRSRKSRYEYDICAISLSNTEIQQHILGAIQEYLRFDNPDWLS